MRKAEFLQELREALEGEVPSRVIAENVSYYDAYISQEAVNGRREEDVIDELGGPRIIARTIIDSCEAAGEGAGAGAYTQSGSGYTGSEEPQGRHFHYIDLSKWYWKLLASVVTLAVIILVMTVVGGIFSLFFRFAGPLILIWLIYNLIKGMRK